MDHNALRTCRIVKILCKGLEEKHAYFLFTRSQKDRVGWALVTTINAESEGSRHHRDDDSLQFKELKEVIRNQILFKVRKQRWTSRSMYGVAAGQCNLI